ncbi:MAG TPA: isoleucine--tRNA ligase [Caulobacteraceae bacterium]|jgi:isoleucyl-tRNA synthetase
MADTAETPVRDYRETVFLPETPFPMRAGLPQREPDILARWSEMDLYAALRRERQSQGAPLFVLHDGPPYANGAIHIGHALNKILKDFVVRSRFLLGYDVDYVPGWDCHGLPIEWKVEEEFRAKGRRKDEIPAEEFRTRCREYAAHWMDVQKPEFQRLGVLGDWERRYATMDFEAEAAIVAEFHKVLMSGQLYRGSKPVMWSPVERTALADAEVEYHDHTSPTIWVKFPVVEEGDMAERLRMVGRDALDDEPDPAARGASVVIWTTTPWTIPGNRAIAYGERIAYAVYEVSAMETDLPFEPWAKPGDRLILAEKLAEDVREAAKIASWRRLAPIDPSALTCLHPLANLDPGYRYPVPLLPGEHVTDEAGTGFVHTAPSHGQEDYQVWLAAGRRDIPDMVDERGAYYDHVPLFGGLAVLETEGKKAGKFGPANAAVTEKLIEARRLLARGRLEHSYPHSWRSKAPVLFRNTPQWFIRMDEPQPSGASLRQTALASIDQTRFFPEQGRNRIRGMVEGRPDWLVSRQRAWGTPLAMFVDRETGQPLRDAAVNARIHALVAAEGADAWFTRPPSDFLGDRDPERYEKVDDILDVWFDSGSTHAFTLEPRLDSGAAWPADLYLEGSDQHRGWFQSSLLESCATRGRAPFKALLTHGFTLDEQGEKMSKSRGNTVEPQTVIKESGADILRLWVAMVDYVDDQRIGKTILQTTVDAYRKLRNTVRYLLGALADFDESERLPLDRMPPLERFVLSELQQLDERIRGAYERYDFQDVTRSIADFCAQDLSAFYFDIRKDSLYCDRPDSERRRAARTVMDLVFERLTAWLSPLLSFTMDEAWSTRFPDAGPNALRVLPQTPQEWFDRYESERWRRVQRVLNAVTAALEVERREKRIGSALEAAPVVHVNDPALQAAFKDLDPAEVFRTSQARIVLGENGRLPEGAFVSLDDPLIAVEPFRAEGRKCARSWKVLPEVQRNFERLGLELTDRDVDAVAWWDARRGAAA